MEPTTLKPRRIAPPHAGIAHAVISLGAVSLHWSRQAMSVHWPQNTPKVPFWCEDDIGNMVAESRNELVMRVLSLENEKLKFSHIFWHDDDVVLISAMALLALHSHDEPIVSGVYFVKGEFGKPLIYPERLVGQSSFEPDKCFEAWGCGSGLTLVQTEVYKRMLKELDLGTDCRGNPKWYCTTAKEGPKVEGNAWNMGGTEDLYFCENAAQLGYKPLIDTGKHCFGFHYDLFGDYGTPKVAYPREQWDEYRKHQRITWKTKDGDVVWR